MGKDINSSDEESKPTVAKTPVELQRFKLEKLMKNPDKPVVIPERLKEKKMPHVPEFVRNVMGSSAGAGSGEFHVYRHLRRKEYARQKFIQEKSEKQLLEEAYHQKLLDNVQAAEERTAKKRAKRLRKKRNYKKKKLNNSKDTNIESNSGQSQTESDSEDLTGDESGIDKDPLNTGEEGGKSEKDGSEKVENSSACEISVNRCSENVVDSETNGSNKDKILMGDKEEEVT